MRLGAAFLLDALNSTLYLFRNANIRIQVKRFARSIVLDGPDFIQACIDLVNYDLLILLLCIIGLYCFDIVIAGHFICVFQIRTKSMQTIDLKFIEYACLRNIQIRHDLQDSAFRLQCTFFTFLVFIGIFFSEQFLYAVINTDAEISRSTENITAVFGVITKNVSL